MVKNFSTKQFLAIIVMILFISVSFTPAIQANAIKKTEKKEFFEVTTEICGIDGIPPYTSSLTREELSELQKTIDCFKIKLEKAKTKQESYALFNDMIVKLDKYGLLGELCVEKTQKLVTKGYTIFEEDSSLNNKLTPFYNETEKVENYLCLIAGQTTNTFFQPLMSSFILAGLILPLELLASIFFILLFANVFPRICGLMISTLIAFGRIIAKSFDYSILKKSLMSFANIWMASSNGWVQTIGLNGVKRIDGYILGKINEFGGYYRYFKAWVYSYSDPFEPRIGVLGFIGLRLNIDAENYESFYIGSALAVKISN